MAVTNIVHFDLKGPNIVFNIKDTKPIIIDLFKYSYV